MRSAPRQPLSFSPRRGWEEAAEWVPATEEVCPLLWGQTTGSRSGLQPGWGGGVLNPQAPLCLALRTPLRPQIRAARPSR